MEGSSSTEAVERIRAASPLSKILADRGIHLQRKGKNRVAPCPFHKEGTPSFFVSDSRGLFHCFGCGEAGDVFKFVMKADGVAFPEAVQTLATRAGLTVDGVASGAPRPRRTTAKASPAKPAAAPAPAPIAVPVNRGEVLARVIEHYHRAFGDSAEAQAYAKGRGLVDMDLLRALRIGYAGGSLLARLPKDGELRRALVELGVLTAEGRELLGGCLVVPIPDPVSGQWATLYGRGVRIDRHCYLPGPMRGVLNFHVARMYDEVVITESVIDAISFRQAGIANVIPIYGTSGFTADHLDLLHREQVRRVCLALDNDEPGRRATETLRVKLGAAGVAVRTARWPEGIKDANELLVKSAAGAPQAFRALVQDDEPPPPPAPDEPPPAPVADVPILAPLSVAVSPEPCHEIPAGRAAASFSVTVRGKDKEEAPVTAGAAPEEEREERAFPLREDPPAPPPIAAAAAADAPAPKGVVLREDGQLVLRRDGGLVYALRVQSTTLGRLRVTAKLTRGAAFHADSFDLYASRSRQEFSRRAAKALGVRAETIEEDLLTLLVEAEKKEDAEPEPSAPVVSEEDRAAALALLRRPDLLDEIGRHVDAIGYVGEPTNTRLLYLVAISRKLRDPLSAIILSQSGAGKSGLTDVIEQLVPPEDVVLFTRLTPQSLYYTEPGFLDQKLIIVEERQGSQEADYTIRVLQSRGRLIVAAPVKDPASGNMRTKVFTVEARAAFVEATTAGAVNHENATRCFEISMDESVEQTRRIHERQRVMKTERGLALRTQAEALRRLHWNAQRLLQPLPVVIPWADQLVFPAAWMRTRRDHARFLNLIEVSAFLHQYQREQRGGAIVATLADYAAAYALAGQVLTDTLSDLKRTLREAFARIAALAARTPAPLSRRAIREELLEPDSTVRRWLSELVDLEYLEVEGRSSSGKAAHYRVVGQRPADTIPGLLTPAALAEKLR